MFVTRALWEANAPLMLRHRLDVAAREISPWAWRGVILRADAVAWSCRHEHQAPAAALVCARHARLVVCPWGRSTLAHQLQADRARRLPGRSRRRA